jgi:hypothetical protein
MSDREQQAEIDEGRQDDGPTRDQWWRPGAHGGMLPGRPRGRHRGRPAWFIGRKLAGRRSPRRRDTSPP